MKGRLFVVLALGCAAFALAPAAGGYVPAGKTWPGGTIRYYNLAADEAWPVARAVWVWNHSGARVRFVATSRADAQLIIGHFANESCVGHARGTVGYGPNASVWLPRIDESSGVCNSYASATMVAHELGHVLGLSHETRGCALMNPSGTWQAPKLCAKPSPWAWRCELLEEDDVRGAVALYGGRAAVTPRECPAYTAMGAPLGFAADASADGGSATFRFTRPALPRLPAFLAAAAPYEGGYAVAGALNRCPTDVRPAQRYRWGAKVGAQTTIAVRLAPGRYCYSVWALDQLGRPSDRPASAWVETADRRRA